MKYAFLCQDITDTVVLAGEFIDKYMTKANGEFVKVYLYLLYHAKEDVTSADIANALNILESDAERAVAYLCSRNSSKKSQRKHKLRVQCEMTLPTARTSPN